jgi:hypothetical protein
MCDAEKCLGDAKSEFMMASLISDENKMHKVQQEAKSTNLLLN